MLHPFVPFVTEEIWKIMNYELGITNYELLIVQPWVEKLDITVSKARALEFIKAREMKKQPTLSETEKKELKSYIASLEARLKNKQFLAKAPPQVVEKERGRLKEANTKLTIAQNL